MVEREKMKKVLAWGPLFFGGLVLLLQFFQNCGRAGFQLSLSSMGTEMSSMGVDHPGPQVPSPTIQKSMLAHRLYVAEMFIEIFGSHPETIAVINDRIFNRPALFGYPCNPKRGDCFTTSNVPMVIAAETLRSANKMQACLTLTGQDFSLVHALNLFEPNFNHISPNQENISALLELFYRGDDPPPELLSGLMYSDRETFRQDPALSLMDRWRLLILAVCESPGWESL